MIAKIVTAASFGGCTAYAYGKDQAEVIAHDGIIPDDPKIAAKCFEIQSHLNPRVSKPVGHIAISFKPEDKPRLTNEFMVQLAKEYMEKMGINDTQYVIVRHHNTPNPHCHLIFNRVDNNGKRISESNWLKRNVRICKELKQKYGLTFGEGKSQTIMAKQNNSLTELQALEGIYEHLSTIDNLAKEVGAISTRLRKIEERLKEPMEITDPMLKVGNAREYSRNTCIYGALIKSVEACIGLTDQKNVLNDIVSDVRHVKSALETIKKDQAKQNSASEDMMTTIKENAENVESNYKLIFAMFFLVVIAIAVLAVTLRLRLCL